MKTYWPLWIILFCPTALWGQQITGTVFEEGSNLPVAFATVYIDGTTVGCLTGSNGNFVLESPAAAGKLVVSHVSYITEVAEFTIPYDSTFSISLSPKIIMFEQVSKSNTNRRAANLSYFKDVFLGSDTWGRDAIIENDSVLFFKIEYYASEHPESGKVRRVKSLEVEAEAPLIITLPKLGYTLQYDLVHFIDKIDTIVNKRVISSLGYYYYQPMQTSSNMLEWEHRSNRLLAYYYSPKHFARSLYNNKLLENGYILYENPNDPENLFSFDSCECRTYTTDEVKINGMKGHKLYFIYFSVNDAPVDLTRSKTFSRFKKSSVYFKDDVVIIRKDGSLPGGSLLFDSEIGKKRIGASLPSDYYPNEKNKKRKPMESQKMHEQLLKKVQL